MKRLIFYKIKIFDFFSKKCQITANPIGFINTKIKQKEGV